MLVLSRKEDQEIHLRDEETGKEITIMVVETGTNVIKLGIKAPRSITIERDDIVNNQPQQQRRVC